ncbi:hypothetical protein D3C84_1061700 [compost metagenome]
MQQAGFITQHDALCTGLGQLCGRGCIPGIGMLVIVSIGQGGNGGQAVGLRLLHGVAQT